ncbi:hypothetical protein ACIPJM_14395 [Streptomyces halstedii]|uniref:hypothetical protein n=1 Tax=Streptomyces halstedii TaxID=1944 RepID=UPI0038112DA8
MTALADPAKARKGVQGDVNGLFLVLGLVSLVVGVIGTADVTRVTVIERVGEIGLRCALGPYGARPPGSSWWSRRRSDSSAVSWAPPRAWSSWRSSPQSRSGPRSWMSVSPLGAPAAGALVGLLAGLYPSLRASRMDR